MRELGYFDVVSICKSLFGRDLDICGSDVEPYFQPAHLAASGSPTLYVMRDSLPSLLHELSHWCIAGKERRQLPDFGYWYKPDGRNIEEQREFQAFESKPQAIEWMFSVAVGREFVVSFDNLNASSSLQQDGFKDAFILEIIRWAKFYSSTRLPPRAAQLLRSFCLYTNRQQYFDSFKTNLLSDQLRPPI